MLISVKFSNFRSYLYEQTLSLVAEKEQLLKENTFNVNPSLFNGKLLKTAMIAGTNASGKTNLFNVVKYIRFLVLSSSEAAREKRNVLKETNEIFALRKNSEEVPMSFEIEFLVDNEQYYLYRFSVRNFSIEYEALFQRVSTESNRLSKVKCLFERKEDKIIYSNEEFAKLVNFVEVKPNVLFLSNCNSDIKDDVCPSGKKVVKWFAGLNYFNNRYASLEIYEENHKYLEQAAKILQKTDKSLRGLKIVKTKIDLPVEKQKDPEAIVNALERSNISIGSANLALLEDGLYNIDITVEYIVYELIDDKLMEVDAAHFSVFDNNSKISLGQAKLIRSLAFVLKVLDKGGVLFWDELDARLHHQFPELITNAFNNPEINKNNAQLIFTTHSANLMDNKFRRDQINIVVKDEYGISRISHPQRELGRIKSTSKLSALWLSNEMNTISTITTEDLKEIIQ